MKNNKKKSSTARKLLPAFAMLTVSAISLSTSTYAWFTMNDSVEVKNINLTASAPSGIEISFGKGTNAGTLATGDTYVGNLAVAPTNEDWTNVISFADYYTVSTLKPASSVDGKSIFATDGSNQSGKKVPVGATFTNVSTLPTLVTGDNAQTNGTANQYYIEIPVWFRSMADSSTNLGLAVSVIDADSGVALKTAARVALLSSDKNTSYGVYAPTGADYFDQYSVTNGAVNKAGTIAADGESAGATFYGAVTLKDSTATLVTLPGKTEGNTYGAEQQYFIRVWLEGEDVNCWNDNAGQDFDINLTFSVLESN